MDKEILDDNELDSIDQIFTGYLMAVGLFLYLVIVSGVYLIDLIIRDVLIQLEINSEFIFWARELIELLIIILSLILVTRKLKVTLNKLIFKKYLRRIVLAYIIIQSLQFGYTFFQFELWPEELLDGLGSYYEEIGRDPNKITIESVIQYLKYILFGVFFIRI